MLTKTQRTRITSLVEAEESLVAGVLSGKGYCGDIGRCITGALMAAAGIPEDEFQHSTPTSKQFKILRATYGLTEPAIDALMSTNDNHDIRHEYNDHTGENYPRGTTKEIMADRRDMLIGLVQTL